MEKNKQIAVAIIGGSIAVVGGISVVSYWLQRRKMIEQETLKDLQEPQPNISQERFIRPKYSLLRVRHNPRRVKLRVLEKHEYENPIEKEELKKQKRKRRVARFDVMRSPFR